MTPRYRTCLITGASSGIGHALGLHIAAQGVEVVLCARREAELTQLAKTITDHGGNARVQVLDVADTTRTVEIVREVDEALGGLDLIIANAGVGIAEDLDPHSWEAMAGSVQINFAGAVATLSAVLPQMKSRKRGHLVGVSSLASFGSLPGAAAYCAPKAGLSMFLDCLRLDLAGSGVAVTTIHPGFVRTPMLARAQHPTPQLVEPDRAAALIWTRLQDQPARIDFPQPLAWLTRLVGGLPRFVHDFIMRLVPAAR